MRQAERDNLLAEMLEDFARLSGEDLGDILAEGFAGEEKSEDGYKDFPLDDPDSEDTVENPFDDVNDSGDDIGDYLDDLFDDIDVSQDEEDVYGD